jgi:hypothetical protein
MAIAQGFRQRQKKDIRTLATIVFEGNINLLQEGNSG